MKLSASVVDITTLEIDAIVNAANSALVVGGGVDGAIHRAAGPELVAANAGGLGCPTGQVIITRGFNLPAAEVFHTVGPDMRLCGYELGNLLLESCYRTCMFAAESRELSSIAFPCISTGIFDFDRNRAAAIAVVTVREFNDLDIEVTFACFSDEDAAIIQAVIDKMNVED